VACEHVLEIESGRPTATEPCRRHLVSGPVATGAQLVVGLAPGGIAQRLVGLVDGLELVLGAGLLADIGMVFARKPAIGGLDLRVARVGLDAQDAVVILELPTRSTTTARVRAVEVYRCADARSVSGRRADLDPPRRGLRALGDHDLQHAVATIGGHALRVGAVRQREAALEAAVAAR